VCTCVYSIGLFLTVREGFYIRVCIHRSVWTVTVRFDGFVCNQLNRVDYRMNVTYMLIITPSTIRLNCDVEGTRAHLFI